MEEKIMEVTMQSTAISNERRDATVLKVMDELELVMSNVFGPKATDIYISTNIDNNLYFTRDGKEVFSSINFDNPLAQQIKNVVGQAVRNQADTVGDGTSTVSLIIPKMVKAIMKIKKDSNLSTFEFKRAFKSAIEEIRDEFRKKIRNITYKTDSYKSLVYTTTGDDKFYKEITANIENLTGSTLVNVLLNENSTEIVYDYIKEPKLDSTLLYSASHLKREDGVAKLDNCALLFVEGSLSISRYQTFAKLALLSNIGIKNVVIFCASMDNMTPNVLRDYRSKFVNNLPEESKRNLANIVILRLPKFVSYDKEELLDVATLVYGTDKKIGIGYPIDFEVKLYTVLKSIHSATYGEEKLSNQGLLYNEFDKYNTDEEIATIIEDSLVFTKARVEISDKDSRIIRDMTPGMKNRIENIKKALKTTTSHLGRSNLENRLAKFEADRLTVRVGAEILSNAQNHTELLLDALKASITALDKGIIAGGALAAFYKIINDRIEKTEQNKIYFETVKGVVVDLLSMIYPSEEEYGKLYINGNYYEEYKELSVVEPAESGLKVLDAIDLSVDIACSTVFISKNFIGNYI